MGLDIKAETCRSGRYYIFKVPQAPFFVEHLLTELPKLKEFNDPEEDKQAMERLLPWSEALPEIYHKRGR